MRRSRSSSGRTARYGAAGESGAWKVVYTHYNWDRLDEAYAAASELGAGSAGHGLVGFRMIEGEWMTRRRGQTTEVNEWLTLETLPDETPMPVDELARFVVAACDDVALRLGFQHGPKVLLSVLAEESNVPWMPGRNGYCIDKFPYEKICIPNRSLFDPEDLRDVVQHEYAHVVTLNTTDGQCPHWLDEAVAMVLAGGEDKRAWAMLRSGQAEWKPPEELDRTFGLDREDDAERREVWLAYQQSAVLGAYLASLRGEGGLGELLKHYERGSLVGEVWNRLIGLSATDVALRKAYGSDLRSVFAGAYAWLLEGRAV